MDQKLSVVIPTYNRSFELQNCLESLVFHRKLIFEIIIADGGSSDNTLEVIENYKKKLPITLLIIKKKHLAYVRDRLWKVCKGSIIASIDDDVVVGKQWALAIIKSFDNNTIAGVTGPTIISKDRLSKRAVFTFHSSKNPIIRMLGWIYFHVFMQGERYGIGKIYPSGAWSPGSNFLYSLKFKKPIEVDYLEACNCIVRRELLEKIGGYDLNYRETSEWCEVDVSFKIRKLGYKLVFNPKIAVEHNISRAGVYKRRYMFMHRLYNLLYFYTHTYYPKSIKGYLSFSAYFIFTTIYYLTFRLFNK